MATVIFKATTACNSRCAYCDGVREGKRSPRPLPLEMLEKFFFRVNEFLMARPEETMEIIWHGGEPLLLGPKYYEEALRFQQKHCAQSRSRIRHCIQSNLTLLKPEMLPPLKELGITSFGSSYEMIPNVRGLGPGRDSLAYNRRFLDAVALLEKEGFSWGIIYVVTRPALDRPLEVFQHLANLIPKGAFGFNQVLLYGRDLDYLKITPEEFADFLGAIFPEWWKRREELPQVHPFDSIVDGLLGQATRFTCCDSGICARTHFSVLPDGAISHCGRSADWDLLEYGSIMDRSLMEVFDDPQRKVLLQRDTVLPETDCKDCRFWQMCHGGCPLDAWSVSGSFLHKSEWCMEKKRFIEKYVDPVLNAEKQSCKGQDKTSAIPPAGHLAARAGDDRNGSAPRNGEATWIDPYGGLGDTLMLSGVLKQAYDKDPSLRFNLVDRTKYRAILEGHPAIASIGYPPQGARLLRTDYWSRDEFRVEHQRAYQVLAGIFDVQTPAEETLYVPWKMEEMTVLTDVIPWKSSNILISHSSVSPRKEMPLKLWEQVVERLGQQDILCVQATMMHDRYIRGAYSLLGLLNPRQLISILHRFDAVLTSDSLLMHAAHLCGIPAVVVWGPTDHCVYGYAEQVHLQAKPECEFPAGCLSPDNPDAYTKCCPHDDAHCMNSHSAEAICGAVLKMLNKESKQGVAAV